jgi:hypothetical protein
LGGEAGTINANPPKVEAGILNMFWAGILAGMIVSAFAPGWVKGLITVVAALLSRLVMRVNPRPPHQLQFVVHPYLIALAGVVFGVWSWHYARKRGLQHLGATELQSRWTAVKGISKWGW